MIVSIVICTYNRSDSLRRTLMSLARAETPAGITRETVVVDNGSTDDTREVVTSAFIGASSAPANYVIEPRRGLGRARNAAVPACSGEILLFSDDDVQFPRDWIDALCEPITLGRAHAVAGGVRIPVALTRSWMTAEHRGMLASTEVLDRRSPSAMFGANMAISREVLRLVPSFNEELGAGTIYTGEDTLFSWQLVQAGFRIASAFDTVVDHYFDESRLSPECFIDTAARRGRFLAYALHHWRHRPLATSRPLIAEVARHGVAALRHIRHSSNPVPIGYLRSVER